MKERLYNILSSLSVVAVVCAAFIFDKLPNLRWLAWVLVIVGGTQAAGIYLYRRINGEQDGEAEALLVPMTTPPVDVVRANDLNYFAICLKMNDIEQERMYGQRIREAHVRHILRRKYQAFLVRGASSGSSGFVSLEDVDIRSAVQRPNEMDVFVSVVHTLYGANAGKDLEVVLAPDGEITVRPTRARREERTELSTLFEGFSVSLPIQ